MMRDMRVYVQDIMESVEVIGEYIQSLSEEEFYRNRQVQDAVLRRLEIIGEAVRISTKISEIGMQKYHGERSQG
jgi:uncharacterized protein with HEPN domain